MQRIILSPPISNLISIPGTSRILGSYTLEPRRGIWRNLTTLRLTEGGCYNKVGLRNPGIKNFNKSGIVSLAGFSIPDFECMLSRLAHHPKVEAVEFNISCPNASVVPIDRDVIALATRLFGKPIIKVPHMADLRFLLELIDMGDIILHVSNSKATPRGALSGKELVSANLTTIRKIFKLRPDTEIIGGGGIYDLETLERYMNAGADYFSLSSVLYNPYKTYKIITGYNREYREE